MSPTRLPCGLSVRGVGKRYADPVLVDVDLDVQAGEIHALMGANGAGKSTLARIICGLVTADSGAMTLDGSPYAPRGKAEAERAGVHIVQQELNLIGTLSIAENLFLAKLPHRGGWIRYGELAKRARTALERVELDHLDPFLPVDRLGVGQQQLVEIAAALAHDCRLLILDEPTAALTAPQIESLFAHLRRLRANGVGMIYVSHRMEELQRLADRVTLLRDGHVVTTRAMAEMPLNEAVRLMAGNSHQASATTNAPCLGATALTIRSLRRRPLVGDVSLTVRQGERLGIAGLVGSGRSELLRAVFGEDPADAGTIRVGDGPERPAFRSPHEAVQAGLAMIPEDRKEQGLLLTQSVRANVTLNRLSLASLGGLLQPKAEAMLAAEQVQRTQIHCRGIEQPAIELSGGNQQKTLIARWLLRDAEVFLFDEPTRGIDVMAKETVYQLLRDLAGRGKAMVIVSSDLHELMQISDRIAVLANGRLVDEFLPSEWSHEKILAAALQVQSRSSPSTNHGT